MDRYMELVWGFNHRFQQGAVPADEPMQKVSPHRALVRSQLNYEELGELAKAIAGRDFINTLGELCDVEFVLCGAACVTGSCRLPDPNYKTRIDLGAHVATHPLDIEPQHLLINKMGNAIAHIGNNLLYGEHEALARSISRARLILADIWRANQVNEDLKWRLFYAIHEANMAKLFDGKPGVDEAGRIQKPEGWKPADLLTVYQQWKARQ